MFRFSKSYFIVAMLLFLTEVYIALCIRDDLIRPYGGDFLVVIFLYYLVRSMMNIGVREVAAGVLLFSFVIEFVQYLNVIEMIGLKKYAVARVILGTSFEWGDMLAYTCGIAAVVMFESRKRLLAV